MLKLGAGAACRRQYRNELRRQTDRYAAWIAEEETKDISGKQITGGPLITVVPFSSYQEWKQSYQQIEYHTKEADILDFASMNGEYVAFVNGDGLLEEHALLTISDKLNHDLIYSDEDCIRKSNKVRTAPFFMPDMSPDTLDSVFYFQDFFVVKRSLASQIRTSKSGTQEERLYEFIREYAKKTETTLHITDVLYHRWIEEDQDKITHVINKFQYPLTEREEQWVSIIILSKDHPDVLKQCTESLRIKLQYNKFEVVIVDNGSTDEVKEDLTMYCALNGFKYVYKPMEFNYSALCAIGAGQASRDYFLFLNDDIEVGDGMFLRKMMRYAMKPHVGAVGAKLLYPDSKLIQHAGITNLKCGPSHKLSGFTDELEYDYGRNRYNCNMLAVTGACLLVTREKYFQVGGFSDKMGVSYNDVDLCVSLYEKGYFNVLCNDTYLYHHESLSRGTDVLSSEKYERLVRERRIFYSRHPWLKNTDPFYNRNLIQDTLAYDPNVFSEANAFGYYNTCRIEEMQNLSQKLCADMELVIEKSEYVRGFDSREDDYYRIEGWSLHKKKDNACLSRELLLVPENGQPIAVQMSSVVREDVPTVFPKAKNSELAGFVCRIRAEYLTPGMIYQTYVSAKSQLSGREYRCAGEPYEPTGK